jgi:Arc/MetJ-type ribon-helix-helix transcriptional regulator
MRVIQIELPDKVAAEMEALVQEGWFADETEIIRIALADFVRQNRLALLEQFQRDDIVWALGQKKDKA